MGRNLACGIAGRIEISNNKSWYCNKLDIKKEKSSILNELGKNLDLDFYNIRCNKGSIILDIKMDKVKESLYELLCEMNNYMKINTMFSEMLEDKDADMEDYLEPDDIYFFSPRILLSKYENYLDIKIDMYTMNLWIDCNRIDIEDETSVCELLTKFSRNTFKTKLSKTLVYYILG